MAPDIGRQRVEGDDHGLPEGLARGSVGRVAVCACSRLPGTGAEPGQSLGQDGIERGDGVPVAAGPLPAQGVGRRPFFGLVGGLDTVKSIVARLPVGPGCRQVVRARSCHVLQPDLADNEFVVVDGDGDLEQHVGQPVGVAQGDRFRCLAKGFPEQDRALVAAGRVPGALVPGRCRVGQQARDARRDRIGVGVQDGWRVRV